MPSGSVESILTNNINNNVTNVENKSTQDKAMFMKLLVAQMKNQDPLNPTDNTAYMQQLSQYSMLETLQNIGKQFENLISIESSVNLYGVLNSAMSVVGKNVEMLDGEKTISGKVEKVSISNDSILVKVNGKDYEYRNITAVY